MLNSVIIKAEFEHWVLHAAYTIERWGSRVDQVGQSTWQGRYKTSKLAGIRDGFTKEVVVTVPVP